VKWIGNIYDPHREDAPEKVARMPGESPMDAWRRVVKELNGKFIGPPKETAEHNVAELKALHIVGVYEDES